MFRIELTDSEYRERYQKTIKQLEACINEAVLQSDTRSLEKIGIDIRKLAIDIRRFADDESITT